MPFNGFGFGGSTGSGGVGGTVLETIETENDLPSNAIKGQQYFVKDTSTIWVWNSESWVNTSTKIGFEQADTMQSAETKIFTYPITRVIYYQATNASQTYRELGRLERITNTNEWQNIPEYVDGSTDAVNGEPRLIFNEISINQDGNTINIKVVSQNNFDIDILFFNH